MPCSASSSVILTHRMQVKSRKGAIHSITAKTRAPKIEKRARAVLLAIIPVKTTSRSPIFLANILFAKNQTIKLPITGRKPACSACLDCLAQPKQNTKPLQFPIWKLKSKKRSTSPLDLASGNLGGAAITAAVASHIQQPNCDSMPNIACNVACAVAVA